MRRGMVLGWVVAVCMFFAVTTPTAVSAQSIELHLELEDPELRAIRAESHEVTAVYTWGASFLSTSIAMAIGGALTLFSGDVAGPGWLAMAFLPVTATPGVTFIPLAAGYQTALMAWRATHGASPERTAAVHADLSARITVTYGVGAGIVGASLLAMLLMYVIGEPLSYPARMDMRWYLVPGAAGIAGLATFFAGIGMDIGAGAWSGFSASVAPLPGGAAVSARGAF